MTRWMTTLCLFVFVCGIGAHGSPPKVQTSAHGDYLVPAYGGTYSQTDDLLLQIRDELRGLRKDVQTLKLGQAQGGELTLASLTVKHCAACHKVDVATDKGGDFVMVEKDNAVTVFSVPEVRRIVKKVKSGTMPPDHKLSEEEKKPFLALDPKEQEQQRK